MLLFWVVIPGCAIALVVFFVVEASRASSEAAVAISSRSENAQLYTRAYIQLKDGAERSLGGAGDANRSSGGEGGHHLHDVEKRPPDEEDTKVLEAELLAELEAELEEERAMAKRAIRHFIEAKRGMAALAEAAEEARAVEETMVEEATEVAKEETTVLH